ncbi:hypothetical protein ACROYT_G028245 [Oculina patagonica]
MHYPPNYSTVGLACGSSPFNDVVATTNKARQNPYSNPSLRTHFPSHPTTVELGCGSSPFSDAPSMFYQTSRNNRLSPFQHHYQPYAHSTAWDTKRRAAQSVSPVEGMKQHWKRQADPPLCHDSFHHCYTLICHCSHVPCPKRRRQEEASNLLSVSRNWTCPEHPSAANPDLSPAACRQIECKLLGTNPQPCTGTCQQIPKLSHFDAKEIQEPLLKTARDEEVEKPATKQSDRAMNTNYQYEDNKVRLKSGNSSLNTSSIHCTASPELRLKHIPVEPKQSKEIPNPTSPSGDINIGESLDESDSECIITYVGKAKKSQESRQSVMHANIHQERMLAMTCQSSPYEEDKSSNVALFDKQSECQLSTWDKGQRSPTNPPQKLQSFDEDPWASLKVPQQKRFDEGPRVDTDYGDSQQSEDIKQLSKELSEVQSCTKLGFATHKVQTNATPERLDNTSCDDIEPWPGDSKLSRTSKFSSQEASEEHNPLSPLLSCSAECSIPTDPVYNEDDLAENDWAGYGYDHNDLPRIVAVHTISKEREENAYRKEMLGGKRLSSNEKKEWYRLLEDLSSSADGYHEVENKTTSSNVYGLSKPSGARATSNQRYMDPRYSRKSSGLAEKPWGKTTFLPSKQPQKETQRLSNSHLHSGQLQVARFSSSSVKIQNDIDNTIREDSHYVDNNEGHVEETEKWTVKELLPTKEPITPQVNKLKTSNKTAEILRQKIKEAEKKIEKEKIACRKNSLYKLKNVLVSRLKILEEQLGEKG